MYQLILLDSYKERVKTLALVYETHNCTLQEAKAIIDNTPSIIVKGLTYSDALSIQHKFEELGATVDIQSDDINIKEYLGIHASEKEKIYHENSVVAANKKSNLSYLIIMKLVTAYDKYFSIWIKGIGIIVILLYIAFNVVANSYKEAAIGIFILLTFCITNIWLTKMSEWYKYYCTKNKDRK